MKMGNRVFITLIVTALMVLTIAFIETIITNYIAFYIINKHIQHSKDKLVWKTFWFCILSDVIGLLCSYIICAIMSSYLYVSDYHILIYFVFIIIMIIISALCIVIFSYFKILKNAIASKKKKLSFSILIAILSAPYFAFIPFAELSDFIFFSLG